MEGIAELQMNVIALPFEMFIQVRCSPFAMANLYRRVCNPAIPYFF
jgi:hypothetical protein